MKCTYLFELVSSFSLDKYSEVELLNLMTIIFLNLWELPYCFPYWLHQFASPPTMLECSLLSTSSPTFVFCSLFDNNHSDRFKVVSYCGCDLHFPNYLWCCSSICLLTLWISYLQKCLFISFVHVLIKLSFLLFLLSCVNSFKRR